MSEYLSAANTALGMAEAFPVIGQAATLGKAILDIAERKKDADSSMKKVCDAVSRVEGTLQRFVGAETRLDITIRKNLQLTRDCLEDLEEHVQNWDGKGGVGKLWNGSKYKLLFDGDIKTLKSLLSTLELAMLIDVKESVDRVEATVDNIEVTVDDTNAEVHKLSARKNRRELEEAEEAAVLKDAEIPYAEIQFESDECFAKGGSAEL
jgi:hypothetical protein